MEYYLLTILAFIITITAQIFVMVVTVKQEKLKINII